MARKLWHALDPLDPEAQNFVLSSEHMRAICAESRELERELEEIAVVLYGNKDILDSPGALASAVRTLASNYEDLYAEKNKAVLDERERCAHILEAVRGELQGTVVQWYYEQVLAAIESGQPPHPGWKPPGALLDVIPETAAEIGLGWVAKEIEAFALGMAEGEVGPTQRTMAFWVAALCAHACAPPVTLDLEAVAAELERRVPSTPSYKAAELAAAIRAHRCAAQEPAR